MHRAERNRGVLLPMQRAAATAASISGGLQPIFTGQMEKERTTRPEIISNGSERSLSSWDLAWGGDWKSIIDKPHVYLPDWGSGTGILKQKYGTFENFKKTWVAEGGAAASQPSAPQVSITDLKEVKSGSRGLRVLASPTLIIRATPKGTDTGKRYTKDQRVQPIGKCFADGDPWIQTADGWISGKYLEGWILQDGRWWYLLSGYTYRHDTVSQIDGQAYAFDSDGWMITADRIADDGHIR